MIEMAHVMRHSRFVDMFGICVLFSSALIMITCYTLMAVELLKKVLASWNQVGVQSVTRSTVPKNSESIISSGADSGHSYNPGHLNPPTMAEANGQSGAKQLVSVTATKKKLRNIPKP